MTGYLYILSNFVVYRTPHLIGQFECEVSAWRRVIGQTPLCGGGAFFPVRVPACRESASQCLVGARTVQNSRGARSSRLYLSAAYNGAVVAEVFIPAFGQRLAEEIRIDCIYVLAFLPYNRFVLPCECSTVDTSCESASPGD